MINVAVVRCRRSVDMIGRMYMAFASMRFELDGGWQLAAAPRREQSGEQAAGDREHDRAGEHREVEPGELGVIGRLVAHRPQPEPGQTEPEDTAGEADHTRLDQ